MSEWKRNKIRTNSYPKALRAGMLVEARQRNGTVFVGIVGKHELLRPFHFNISDNTNVDILAYRILPSELAPIPQKTAIELQAEEVGIPEPVQHVAGEGCDTEMHLGVKRPSGDGWIKYNAGDVVDLNGVKSIDWRGLRYLDEVLTAEPPEKLDFASGTSYQIAWYRLNYAENVASADTSPERVEKHDEIEHNPIDMTASLQRLVDSGKVDLDALRSIQHDVNHGPFNADSIKSAPEFLQSALSTLTQRGQDYDKPEGERSAAAVAVAFNAITGKQITDAEVYLVLQLVKDVRQWQNPERYHADSALDCVAYAALKAEALASGCK